MNAGLTHVDIVNKAYGSIGGGDLPGLLGLMADEVEIELPGPDVIPFAGTFRGHDGVAQFASSLVESIDWESRQLTPREFIADSDQVVVLGDEQLTAKVTGRSWDTQWAMVWTLRDGRIVRLREFHQTSAIAEAFVAG